MLYPANNLAKSVDISYSDKRTVEACQVERFVIDEEKRVFGNILPKLQPIELLYYNHGGLYSRSVITLKMDSQSHEE